jgi:putative glutamine amidotransferase
VGEQHGGPLIGITTDVEGSGPEQKSVVRRTYARAVAAAGGVPVLLAPPDGAADDGAVARLAAALVARLDGLVLTGGDDPSMERYGVATHPEARVVHPDRQRFEEALLDALGSGGDAKPALGVCLGMQLMALRAGGALDQFMPDTTPTHADHEGGRRHPISRDGDAGAQGLDLGLDGGEVVSRHRQAIVGAGSLRVIARAPDGVVEAIADPGRAFHVGVQWHPERTGPGPLGDGLFERLVRACGG